MSQTIWLFQGLCRRLFKESDIHLGGSFIKKKRTNSGAVDNYKKITFKHQDTGEVISSIAVPLSIAPYETQRLIQDERFRINMLRGIPLKEIVYSSWRL